MSTDLAASAFLAVVVELAIVVEMTPVVCKIPVVRRLQSVVGKGQSTIDQCTAVHFAFISLA